MSELLLLNRQRACSLNTSALRELVVDLLQDVFHVEQYELGVWFVTSAEMARVNWDFLQHEGDTDVITFDHREKDSDPLAGEIYISPAMALKQAKEFETSWQEEIARYLVHGLLHLHGYDDLEPALRKRMKARENAIVSRLRKEFDLRNLARVKPRKSRSR